MINILLWVPATLSFTNNISARFWTGKEFRRRTTLKQIGITFECYIGIDMAKI